jgi:hypothetical protein
VPETLVSAAKPGAATKPATEARGAGPGPGQEGLSRAPADGDIMAWDDFGCLPNINTQGIGAVYAPDAGGNLYLIGGAALGGDWTDQVLRNVAYVVRDGRVNVQDFLLVLASWFLDGCDQAP